MSVSHKEMLQLIGDARARGAVITVTNNDERALFEGRDIIDTVQIANFRGIGPHPMGALSAAERLREALYELPAFKIVVLGDSWTAEALAAGETDQHWEELVDESASEEDLAGLLRKYGVHEPCVSGNGGSGWSVSTKEWDAESFEQGLTKNFTLFVYEMDGSKLSDVNRRRVQVVFDNVNPSLKKSAPVSDGLSL